MNDICMHERMVWWSQPQHFCLLLFNPFYRIPSVRKNSPKWISCSFSLELHIYLKSCYLYSQNTSIKMFFYRRSYLNISSYCHLIFHIYYICSKFIKSNSMPILDFFGIRPLRRVYSWRICIINDYKFYTKAWSEEWKLLIMVNVYKAKMVNLKILGYWWMLLNWIILAHPLKISYLQVWLVW